MFRWYHCRRLFAHAPSRKWVSRDLASSLSAASQPQPPARGKGPVCALECVDKSGASVPLECPPAVVAPTLDALYQEWTAGPVPKAAASKLSACLRAALQSHDCSCSGGKVLRLLNLSTGRRHRHHLHDLPAVATLYIDSLVHGDMELLRLLPLLREVASRQHRRGIPQYQSLADAVARNIARIRPGSVSFSDIYQAMSVLPHQYPSGPHRRMSQSLGHNSGAECGALFNSIGDSLFNMAESKLSVDNKAAGEAAKDGAPWADVLGALSGLCWLRGRRPGVSDHILQHTTAMLYMNCMSYQFVSPQELGNIVSGICHRVGMVSCDRASSVLGLLRGVYLAALQDCIIVAAVEPTDGRGSPNSLVVSRPASRVRYQRAVSYSPSALCAAVLGFLHLRADAEEVSALLLHFSDALKLEDATKSTSIANSSNDSNSTLETAPVLLRGVEVQACLTGMRRMCSNKEYSPRPPAASQSAEWSSLWRRNDFNPLSVALCDPNLVGGPAVRVLLGVVARAVEVSPLQSSTMSGPVSDSGEESIIEIPVERPVEALYSATEICLAISQCQGFSDGYAQVRQLLSALADKLESLDALRRSESASSAAPASLIGSGPRPADIANALFGLQRCHHSFTFSYPTQKLLAVLTTELERYCIATSHTQDLSKGDIFTTYDISRSFFGLKKMEQRSENVLRIVSLLRQIMESRRYTGEFTSVDIGMLAEGLRYLPSRSDDVRAVLGFLARRIDQLPANKFSARETTSCLYALQNMDYMSDELRRFIASVTKLLRSENIKYGASHCALSMLSLRLKPLQDRCVINLIDVLTQKITQCAEDDAFSKYDTVDLQTVLKDLRERHPVLLAKARPQFSNSGGGTSPPHDTFCSQSEEANDEIAYRILAELRTALLQKVRRDSLRQAPAQIGSPPTASK